MCQKGDEALCIFRVRVPQEDCIEMFGGLDFRPLLTAGLVPDLDEAAWGLGQAVSDHLKARRFPSPYQNLCQC